MDSPFHFQGALIALYVTPVGQGRWEVRSSQDGARAFAYRSREAALEIARTVARGQWENWGFACCIYLRAGEHSPWEVFEYFGPTGP